MRIAVIGQWHLGTVTAGCLAHAGFEVIAFDSNPEIVSLLHQGKTPVYEPGLNEIIDQAISNGKLRFTSSLKEIDKAEIIWVTIDTPVDNDDKADVDLVLNEVIATFAHLQSESLVIISSQLPVGSTRKLEEIARNKFPTKNINFAYSPENLRLGKAIEVFSHPDRVIIGLDNQKKNLERIKNLFYPFSNNIIFMSLESAEMTKHAINAFLANSVVFINEISTLCERLGANAHEVELGLKSESRIGTRAYLRPGDAIAGGTLLRDLNYLINLGEQQGTEMPLFSALLKSNSHHKKWSCQKIKEVFENLNDKHIAMIGLTYKAGTDTLRRSTVIETCAWLHQQGATVMAYDPLVKNLPSEVSHFISLKETVHEAVSHADAIIIATECMDFTGFKNIHSSSQKNPYIIDPGGFLRNFIKNEKDIRYFSVGFQQ